VHSDKAGLPTPAFGPLTLWVPVGGEMVKTKADGTSKNDLIESQISTEDLAPLSDHSHPNNFGISFFDVDLARIFIERSTLKIKRIFEHLLYQNYKISKKDIPCLIDEILGNMLFPALKDEIGRYRKKSKNRRYDYKKDIERAREGNNKSLCRLIEWDKDWLFIDWVKNRVLQAQEERDNRFIKELGEAVGAVPRIQRPIAAEDREERKLMIRTMEAAIPYHLSKSPPASRRKTFNWVTKVFFDAFFYYGLPDREPWYSQEKDISTNLDSFRQYIKRHLTINLD
jgi:hypothetical protein